jgi:hypothetical protein
MKILPSNLFSPIQIQTRVQHGDRAALYFRDLISGIRGLGVMFI